MKSFFSERFHCRHDGCPIPPIVTYKAKVRIQPGFGKDISGDYNAGSVWQMKNGEWHAVFHSDFESGGAGRRREIGNACFLQSFGMQRAQSRCALWCAGHLNFPCGLLMLRGKIAGEPKAESFKGGTQCRPKTTP